MKQPNNQKLIDYLDKNLKQDENSEIEFIIQQDKTAAGDLEYLKLAVETIRLNAINDKVTAVRQSLNSLKRDQPSKQHVPVRNMYRTSLRIAAILTLLLGSAVVYKYISVSNQSVYKNQFIPYDLSNTRGTEVRDSEAEAYYDKNWNQVVAIYNAQILNSNKSHFLAAMAEMQLQHYSRAATLFQNILSKDASDNSFKEEAEYYCALAYLMNHEEGKSRELLNKIKSDTSHRYYPLASKISDIDLKIIDLKK